MMTICNTRSPVRGFLNGTNTMAAIENTNNRLSRI